MSRPLSVLMPVYNCGPFLSEAIRSVLAQTFSNFEFVVVNDGSTDGSLDVIRRYAAQDRRLVILDLPNRGIVATLNAGLDLCRGEFVARMDGDDLAMPNRFERQLCAMRNEAVVCLGSSYESIDSQGRTIRSCANVETEHDMILADLYHRRWPGICHPSAMIRKVALDQVGGYHPDSDGFEDIHLWLRLATIGRLANLSDVLLRWRKHLKSTTVRITPRTFHLQQQLLKSLGCDLPISLDAPHDGVHDSLVEWGWQSLGDGRHLQSVAYSARALLRRPHSTIAWKLCAISVRNKLRSWKASR